MTNTPNNLLLQKFVVIPTLDSSYMSYVITQDCSEMSHIFCITICTFDQLTAGVIIKWLLMVHWFTFSKPEIDTSIYMCVLSI